MEHLSEALPASPEQWVAAVTTLVLAIIGFIRSLKKSPPSTNTRRTLRDEKE